MKMLHYHYTLVEHDIAQLPLCEIIQECTKRGYSEKATRWTIFSQVNRPPEFFYDRLHDYLNDNHIDTALRKIVKDQMRESARTN